MAPKAGVTQTTPTEGPLAPRRPYSYRHKYRRLSTQTGRSPGQAVGGAMSWTPRADGHHGIGRSPGHSRAWRGSCYVSAWPGCSARGCGQTPAWVSICRCF